MTENELNATWYGPHACAVCGVTIVKAAREQGGAEYEPPDQLMRVFARGAENGNPDLVYPMAWKPHVHRPHPGNIVEIQKVATWEEPSAIAPCAIDRDLSLKNTLNPSAFAPVPNAGTFTESVSVPSEPYRRDPVREAELYAWHHRRGGVFEGQ